MNKLTVHYQAGWAGGKIRVGYCGVTEHQWADSDLRWYHMDVDLLRIAESRGAEVCEKCGERASMMALALTEL